MDDGHGASTEDEFQRFISKLGDNVMVKREGPFSEGSSYTHLKREREIRDEGTLIRPPVRYIDSILGVLGLKNCKPVKTPAVDDSMTPEDLVPLPSEEATTFRTVVGVALHLGIDRPDIAFIVKELGRFMSTPTVGAMVWARRLARYLSGTRDFVILLPRVSGKPCKIKVQTDSNWAGCKRTRKSTTCFTIWLVTDQDEWIPIVLASRTQTAIALSSGEAEWYAAVSGAAEALYFQQLFEFLLGMV